MQIFHFEDLVIVSADEVTRLLDKLEEFPTLPNVATKILKMVNSPDFSVQKLSELIKMDSALTSKVFKIANSAFYKGNSEINNIDEAIMRLGVSQIKSIVVGISVIKSFKGFQQFDLDVVAFWKHSLSVALLNKTLGEYFGLKKPDDTWIAGILHDIGKLIYCLYMPTLMQRVLSETKEKNITFFEAENNLLKFNHCNVGRWLCEKWGIPKRVTKCVEHHHTPPASRFILGDVSLDIGVCHLSDNIVKKAKIGNSGDSIPKIDNSVWEYLDQDKMRGPEFMEKIKNFKKEMNDLFSLFN
ncbi:MAG: HDOD domain-containing protein [Candidatus Muiribacteriota bacterium]